ncbi:hypothetical protein C1O66_13720 [Paucibacter aquatile]|uniref:DUF4132 domain-containing protein n=1 Tax=Kinneretia aquatilis TaxID=2070761 RepID=A0A2N8KYD1_9BURK|nr:DUF4132 domain-containing protein [Paucibacter aquatile]PND38473.1 hypothetical protein C1O66_13720 [Paucibacter aquatile]
MFKWVNNLQRGQSADLPEGVSSAWAERLEEVLKQLGGDLSGQTLRFVLHGEPLAVLQALKSSDKSSQQLGLTSYGGITPNKVFDLYEHFEQIPPAVGLRWARVLDAALDSTLGRCQMTFEQGVRWPELLLMHSSGQGLNVYGGTRAKARGLTAASLEALCIEDGLSPAAWLLPAFQIAGSTGYFADQRPLMLTDLADYPEALLRHAAAIAPLLLSANVNGRVHGLKMLEPAPVAMLDLCSAQIAELAASTSKQVRAAAEPLLARTGVPLIEALKQLAVTSKPETRLQALRVLSTLAAKREDAALLSFTRDTAAADKAPAVQALITEWAQNDATPTEVSYDYTVPVIDWRAEVNVIAPEVQNGLWAEANAAIEKANAQAREHHARGKAQGYNWPLHVDEPFKASDAEVLERHLAQDGPVTEMATVPAFDHKVQRFIGPLLIKLAEAGHFTPVSLIKTLRVLRLIEPQEGGHSHLLIACVNGLHRASGRPTLLELSQVLEAHGFGAERLLRTYCSRWGQSLADNWPDTDVWPFMAHHQELVIRLLSENTSNDWYFSRAALFKAISSLPVPPSTLVNTLFDLALGSAKLDRALAQEALNSQPDKETRIATALQSSKSEVRLLAAQWLGRLRHEPAVAALENAVRKEKNDLAKGAMLDALQLLGRPVEAYLDRETLAKDAAKFVAKGLPKDLDWFPWAALPAVHWSDTQAAVAPELLQWLLAQACKQKSPEPNAVMRKLCGLMVPRDREALGQFVLETWLAEDVRPGTQEEALQRARGLAQQHWNSIQAYPQYYQGDPMAQMSVDEIAAQFLPGFLRQPLASAIGSKGLLAVAAACCAERAAPPVQRYLKEWYGTRAAQGKALIAMLAWIEHPSATQLMLSVGSRFRTKSFQEEATKQAEALAERKGWTLAELADRTIPSAGFDETGTLTLSYGPREFSVKLLPDFRVELFNPDGKKITALPEPRQEDDAALAKDAKKTLSAAKKELKSIVDLQTDRLYEALCTARDWPAADWRDYLLQHPVLRHIVQRLVWIETLEDGCTQVFRPLDDGSLTDVNDDPVELRDDARVRLAHDSLLATDTVAAWQQHLADYAVKPLFQQFGKGGYALPADQSGAQQVLDFRGHLIEAFALRGRATKLGYSRGSTEDGGWFFTYEKRFPTLGLQAVIEFSGNGLPEENRTVALHHLSFAATGSDRWSRAAQGLGKVPQVLLSECYDDLRQIAAEGSGFDPEWEKKSAY